MAPGVLRVAGRCLLHTLSSRGSGSRAWPPVLSVLWRLWSKPKPQGFISFCKRFIYFDTCGLVSIIYRNTGEGADKRGKVCLTAASAG